MLKNIFLSAIILLFSVSVFAQTAVKPSAVSGEVKSIDGVKIVLKTANGDLEAVSSDSTQYFRVPPETPTLSAAVAATASDIGVGDKVLVTGILSEDKKSIPVKKVYLITKSDIANKQAKEQAEWRTRGISGRVVSYDVKTGVINVSMRGLAGERTVSVTPKEKAEFYRYAPDSVKFSEAKRGVITDIEPGDSIRALGDKSADGAQLQAEKIVTGAFKTVGGTITAVNAEKNEVTISDFQTKKEITVVVTDASVLKQFPADLAQRFATMQSGGGGGMRPPTQGGGQQNPQPNPQPTQGQTPNGMGGGGMRPGGGGGIDDMLDRFPTVKVADLKVGEMIAVSSTKSNDPARVRAIKLLSGVEPFIKMSQMAAAQGGGAGRGAGGGGASLNIPGLDGFGGN